VARTDAEAFPLLLGLAVLTLIDDQVAREIAARAEATPWRSPR
jgi:hypothetical protein